jgi:mRNA interferase MazF
VTPSSRLVKGDVVIVRFPFSDLSATKVRPALVVATLTTGDVLLCQITSVAKGDMDSVRIDHADMETGGLSRDNWARADKLFTASARIVAGIAGRVKPGKQSEVAAKIVEIVRR